MAGRKFSKANEAKLRAALESITALLDQLEGDGNSDSDEAKEAWRKLQEAANLGNWLESRIHLAFTEIADNMFGDGRLTREERIALSSAIGEALTAFNSAVTATVPGVYEREPWREAPGPNTMSEAAIEAEFVPLVEKAVRRDGTIPIKLIQPGWGSSGYYPAEVLERDGPKVFVKGLKAFWNHPTPTEESQRPEGDLNALAAELIGDARWDANGPAGPGLYADAKVFEGYQSAVNDMAKHIGMSIRATGRAMQGEAEGRKGPIVQQLTAAKSVDFVTEPGAGGRVLDMFEAARPRVSGASDTQEESVDTKQLQEAMTRLEQQNRDLQAQNARFSEALMLRDARDFVRQAVANANVPDVTKARLVETLSVNPPVKDGALDADAYATRIAEAIKGEVEYLTKAAGYGSGRIEGMGADAGAHTHELTPEDVQKRMNDAFQRLGLSESAAKVAANGRGY